MNATVDTGEIQHYPGFRAHVSSVRPIVDGGTTVTVQVGSRNLQTDSVSFGSAVSANSSGECPVRVDARYHRYRINTSGTFNFIQGVQATCEQSGMR